MAISAKHVHFVGIGGIGMSALATILAEQGIKVSGCDADTTQKSVSHLKQLGCTIYSGNGSDGCFDSSIDLFVCSTAIKRDMPEIKSALERGIRIISRAELLAELMREKFSIAVAGSHGKTTTSALLSYVLLATEKDPTIIVGGHLGNLGHNARLGKGNLLVAEADESDRSFTILPPSAAIVTNIDLEHLDTYHDLADLQKTFCSFMTQVPNTGFIILCIDDLGAAEAYNMLPPHIKDRVITYGTKTDALARLEKYELFPTQTTATITLQTGEIVEISLPLLGKHNALNATAVCAAAIQLGVTSEELARVLPGFKGVEQRFSFRGTYHGAEIFDDYGHHPTEIAAVLQMAKKRTKNRLLVVFQPHRFSRTQKLWADFVEVFNTHRPDTLLITDIYPASEAAIPGITGEALATACNTRYIPLEKDFSSLKKELNSLIKPDDLLLFLGAGKVNRLSEELTK